MILPHQVTGVMVTGTDHTEGIHPNYFDAMFDLVLRPFLSPNTRWMMGAGSGMDISFLHWIIRNRGQDQIHMVVPYKVKDIVPGEFRETVKQAMHTLDNLKITELDMVYSWPEPLFAAARKMIESSDMVVGFPHESKASSVTNVALNYAASLGLPRIIWPVGK